MLRALITCATVLAGCAFAQDCSNFAQLLRSPELRSKAWAAYLAASCGQRDRGPDLAAELDQMLPERKAGWNTPEYWVVQSLLDALIQLQQPVAPATALALRENWPTESMILLIQNAEASQPQLMFLLDTRLTDPEWLAATSTLIASKTPGFALKTVQETRFSLDVSVVDAGAGFGGGIGSGSVMCGGGLRVPDGFPPVGLYGLTLTAVPGDTVLAAGTHPVYFRRTVADPEHPADRGGEHGITDRHMYRLELLSSLSGLPVETIRSVVSGLAEIRWSGLVAFRREHEAAIRTQTLGIQRLLGALRSAGLLEAAEAEALVVRLHIQLQDHRADRSVSLPAVEEIAVKLDGPPAL